AGLKQGKLKFFVEGERMQGGWTLVRMKPRKRGDRENWLLIKERDEHAGHDPDELVNAYTTSIATARTMEQIANDEEPPEKASTPRRRKAKKNTSKKAAKLPPFRKPQLATLSDTVPDGNEWVHESKFDGYRSVVAVAGDEVRCYSRAGHDWTDKFAPVADALRDLECQSALLDGEVVVPHAVPGSQFSALQAALSSGGPLAFYAFDL